MVLYTVSTDIVRVSTLGKKGITEMLRKMACVLGLARTGLIFTGIQEGTQPGGLTPPGQTEQGIPYHVPSCWVPVGGSWAAELTRGSGAHGDGSGERLCGLCGLCCVFSSSVSLLFLFPLFAVLLNCPYPDPPFSACFFPFSSAPRWGEGRPRGAFVAGRSQTITFKFCYTHLLC